MTKHRFQSGLLLCLLFSFLFQWEGAQMLAWANMIREYSVDRSFTEAVEDTFSGKKPCSMCVKLTESKTSSGQSNSLNSLTFQLADLFAPETIFWVAPSYITQWTHPSSTLWMEPLRLSPPVPPPRFFSC